MSGSLLTRLAGRAVDVDEDPPSEDHEDRHSSQDRAQHRVLE